MRAGVKDFAKSTARGALALLIAGVGILFVLATYYWARERYDEHQAKPFEVIRTWNADLQSNLGLTVTARTKVVSRQLLVAIHVAGYPPFLSDPRLSRRNEDAEFIFHFLDSDGFKVVTKSIKLTSFSRVVNSAGEYTGLRTEFSEHLGVEDYQRFAKLQIEWTIETKLPPPIEAPKANEVPSLQDHCAPNISKAERLRRLAQHGNLREGGTGMYSAGNKSVHFFYDGSLLSCS